MLARRAKNILLAFLLCSAMVPAATVADDPKVQQLEKKVQNLEKQLRSFESLLIELADELALLNMKVMELERRVGVPAK